MFTQNIGRILLPSNVMNVNDASCNCMLHSMAWQCNPTLMHFGMRDGGLVDHQLVVSKHHRRPIDRCSRISECKVHISDLFSGSCGDMLETECRGLNSRLQLGIPIDESLFELMEDSCNWLTTDKVVVKVSIKEWCHSYRLPFWLRSIQRNLFLCVGIAGVFPVIYLDQDSGAIRSVSPDLDCSMAHLKEIHMDSFDVIQVSLSWHASSTEAWESHHCCGGNIKAADLNYPLYSPNQRLTYLLIVFVKQLGGIQFRMITCSQWCASLQNCWQVPGLCLLLTDTTSNSTCLNSLTSQHNARGTGCSMLLQPSKGLRGNKPTLKASKLSL